jgi:hypothetical protein
MKDYQEAIEHLMRSISDIGGKVTIDKGVTIQLPSFNHLPDFMHKMESYFLDKERNKQ